MFFLCLWTAASTFITYPTTRLQLCLSLCSMAVESGGIVDAGLASGSNFTSLVLFRISVKSLSCKKSLVRFLLLLFMFLLLLLLWSLQKNVPFPGYFHKILHNTEDLPLDLLRNQNLTANKISEATETSGSAG